LLIHGGLPHYNTIVAIRQDYENEIRGHSTIWAMHFGSAWLSRWRKASVPRPIGMTRDGSFGQESTRHRP
jgi:hypothetical protein